MAERLGATCRELRERTGTTQLRIATTAGVAESTISRFERGVRWVDDIDEIVAAYATELGVTERSLWQAALDR